MMLRKNNHALKFSNFTLILWGKEKKNQIKNQILIILFASQVFQYNSNNIFFYFKMDNYSSILWMLGLIQFLNVPFLFADSTQSSRLPPSVQLKTKNSFQILSVTQNKRQYLHPVKRGR